MEKVAVAYIPVLHKGYLNFLDTLQESGVRELYLIGDGVLAAHEAFDYLNRKDRLRAVPLEVMCQAISGVTKLQVEELTPAHIALLQERQVVVVFPQEDISSVVADAYFAAQQKEFASIFLRWNRDNVEGYEEPDVESVPMTAFQERIVALMREEAAKSFDWWRQVGSALIKDEEIICVTHNEHLPEAQTPNIEGDVRSLFKKGVNINYSTAAHAEVVALGSAAKAGIATEGAELYVTDFPCPYCARLIASAGITTVYFTKGYAVLEGETFLKQMGVRVIKLRE